MSVPRVDGPGAQAPSPVFIALIALLASLLLVPLGLARGLVTARPDHLVVSEVVTGGASASDELIELYNPTESLLPLEGLELVYVSASGATVSRRAGWAAGAPGIGPGGHLLVANEAGIYASIADAVYATGMAATGGSVALRIQGAASAIDAVGWGTTTSTWREGSPAAVAAAGSSIERLPGGGLGSTVDTDDNASDFTERLVPDPQNSGSDPVPGPGTSPAPSTDPTPLPSTDPTPGPTTAPTPAVTVVPIGDARLLADGAVVTIEGASLTGSDFHDGGGYVADGTGGIAVLVSEGAFAAGRMLRLTGTIDDRFAQRTLRVDASAIIDVGPAIEPAAIAADTGAVGEALEGELVRIRGTLESGATELAEGVAFDLDDGTGPSRIVVWSAAGIETSAWVRGAGIEMIGVVGQRDSSGTGTTGYRVQPRGPFDVLAITPPSSATPTPSPATSASATASASSSPSSAITVAQARQAPKNARVTVRGIVTLPSGVVDAGTAAVQDATGGILLRLSDDARPLVLGELVEVTGARSTKSGMETIRLTSAAVRLDRGVLPTERQLRTGDAGESLEAVRVLVRGAIVAAPRRSSTGSVSFEVDDGSGPLRVVAGAPIGLPSGFAVAGSWIEVVGVLGQETTGSQPARGYRVWPTTMADLRVVAQAPASASDGSTGDGGGSPATAALGAIGDAASSGLVVGATLVAGPWTELGLGGVLWDGTRLVSVAPASTDRLATLGVPPLRVELVGARFDGRSELGLDRVALGGDPGDVLRGEGPPHVPAVTMPGRGDRPAWVSLVGTLTGPERALVLRADGATLPVERRCDDAEAQVPRGAVRALGIGLGDPVRLVVACDGLTRASALETALIATGRRGPTWAPPTAPVPAEPGRVHGSLVAALLGAASLALAGAVAAARADRSDPDGTDPEAVDDAESDASAPDGTTDGAQPRHLTLVPAPRERASP